MKLILILSFIVMSFVSNAQILLKTFPAGISAGDSVSASIDFGQRRAQAVFISSAGTYSGSSISFLVSFDGSSFCPLYKNESGSAILYSLPVTGKDKMFSLEPAVFYPFRFLKVKIPVQSSNCTVYISGGRY